MESEQSYGGKIFGFYKKPVMTTWPCSASLGGKAALVTK